MRADNLESLTSCVLGIHAAMHVLYVEENPTSIRFSPIPLPAPIKFLPVLLTKIARAGPAAEER